jgi:hypothetical protein
MHIRAEHLKANLEALDSESIRARVRSGKLTEQAVEIANAVLAARGQPVERGPDQVPLSKQVPRVPSRAPLPGRRIVVIAFGLYLALAFLCVVVIFADRPWVKPGNGSWEGMFGGLASLAAGFPWTYFFLRGFGATASGMSLAVAAFVGIIVNVLAFITYLRRT